MPLDEYTWIERAEVLSFEEIERLAGLGHGRTVHQGGLVEANDREVDLRGGAGLAFGNRCALPG